MNYKVIVQTETLSFAIGELEMNVAMKLGESFKAQVTKQGAITSDCSTGSHEISKHEILKNTQSLGFIIVESN